MRYVIIHGTFGNAQENRFPWLKEQLELQGHEVRVPELPTQEEGMHEARCAELQKQVPFTFDNDTMLIGHSLGAVFVLDILNRERKKPVKKAILVSGFLHALGNQTFDTLNAPFLQQKWNREEVKKNAEKFVILHWENDPYVPLSEAEGLQEKLWCSMEIIPNGGHLNETAGFVKFEEILKYL